MTAQAIEAQHVEPGDLYAYGREWRQVAAVLPTVVVTDDGARYQMLHITFESGAGLIRHPREQVAVWRAGLIVCGPYPQDEAEPAEQEDSHG